MSEAKLMPNRRRLHVEFTSHKVCEFEALYCQNKVHRWTPGFGLSSRRRALKPVCCADNEGRILSSGGLLSHFSLKRCLRQSL